MRTVRFELLRPDEILAEQKRYPVAFQAIGPLEWHGPHLPYGMDPIHADTVACRAAETIGGVVMPTLYWGTERERSPELLRDLGFKGDEYIVGMDFPANSMKSMYTPEDIFGVVVRARLDLMVRQGYKLIVIVNGHGAANHMVTLGRLATEYSGQTPSRVILVTAFRPDANGQYAIGHADALETSLMMAMHPDAVNLKALPALPAPLRNIDWAVVDGPSFAGHPNADHTLSREADPRQSSSTQAGEAALKDHVNWVIEHVRAVLA